MSYGFIALQCVYILLLTPFPSCSCQMYSTIRSWFQIRDSCHADAGDSTADCVIEEGEQEVTDHAAGQKRQHQ